MVYPALLPLMRTPRLPVVDWTDAPVDLNGLVRFAERRNLASARVPSHLERSLTNVILFLISNCRRVLNVVFFLLGGSLAPEFYVPTFWNCLSVRPSQFTPHMKMGLIVCSETSAHKIRTPRNNPKERIRMRSCLPTARKNVQHVKADRHQMNEHSVKHAYKIHCKRILSFTTRYMFRP